MPFRSRLLFINDAITRERGIQEMIDNFEEVWLNKHELPDGQNLYHYTTVDGLKGIFSNRALWFGHYTSFNDPLELQYGKNLVLNILADRVEQNDDDILAQFYQSIDQTIKGFGRTLQHAYIACFCESGNLLSQWRAYSDSGGFCIGFDFTSNTLIGPQVDNLDDAEPPILRKVIYEKETQTELVNLVLDETTDNIKEKIMGKRRAGFIAARTGSDISNLLVDLILSFKHSAFEEEQEWRMIRTKLDTHEPDKLNFRNSNGNLVPYLSNHVYLNSDDELCFPVQSLQFGPSLEEERTRISVKLFLKHILTTNEEEQIKIPEEIEIMGSNFDLRT